MGTVALIAFWLGATCVDARVGSPSELVYPLRRRTMDVVGEMTKFTLEELPSYEISYSEDSAPKIMSPFVLALFETDGLLPLEPSLYSVQGSLEDFLVAELDALYGRNHRIQQIDSKVRYQKSSVSTRRDRRAREMQVRGSELEMDVNVTFANEPSPDAKEVNAAITSIMANLDYFLTNLSYWADGDLELADVHSAFRFEIETEDEPSQGVDGETDPSSVVDPFVEPRSSDNINVIIPVICAISAVLILVGLLAFRRRRATTVRRDNEEPEAGVLLEDDDLFSFETALVDSPSKAAKRSEQLHEQISPRSSSAGGDNHSDVFSGINSEYTSSPRRRGGSLLSFFSARTGTSTSTVQVSNREKDKQNHKALNTAAGTAAGTAGAAFGVAAISNTTPHSRVSSLFTFSEEGENDSKESDDNNPSTLVSSDGSEAQARAILGHSPMSVESPSSQNGSFSHMQLDTTMDGSYAMPTMSPSPRKGVRPLSPGSRPPRSPSKTPNSRKSNGGFTPTVGGEANVVSSNLDLEEPAQATSNAKIIWNQTQASPTTSPSSKSQKSEGSRKSTNSKQVEKSPGSEVGLEREMEADAPSSSRRHAQSDAADGTKNYQNETMDPQDWSLDSGEDGMSMSTGAGPSALTPPDRPADIKTTLSMSSAAAAAVTTATEALAAAFSRVTGDDTKNSEDTQTATPKSYDSSLLSGVASGGTNSQSGRSETNASKQLISDLVWLEKKISGTAVERVPSPDGKDQSSLDSLSFTSDGNGSMGSHTNTEGTPKSGKNSALQGLQTILCRDCYAPPGKLKIVIHSTKDGPAVHTVKPGSSLEGHIFPGDLIISVDNVDTRSYTAEQVMKMMTARSRFERKITVLHFEEAEEM